MYFALHCAVCLSSYCFVLMLMQPLTNGESLANTLFEIFNRLLMASKRLSIDGIISED